MDNITRMSNIYSNTYVHTYFLQSKILIYVYVCVYVRVHMYDANAEQNMEEKCITTKIAEENTTAVAKAAKALGAGDLMLR